MASVQAIMSIAVTVSWPFLPLFVIELGVREPHVASLWAGLIASIQFLVAALVSPFWGTVADRVGRKAMVLRTSGALAVFTCLMGFSRNVYELLVLSTLYGLLSGFATSAIALVATNVPEDRLGFALGWMSTAQLAGTLIGPLIGGLLADALQSYRDVYWVSSAAGFAGVAVAAFFVHERSGAPKGGPKRSGFLPALRETLRHPQLAPLFVVLLLAQASGTAVAPVVAPFVKTLLPDSPWLATFAGAAIAITGIADLLASPFLGKRSDVIGYRRVLLISVAGAAAFTIPQAFAHSIWMFLLLRFGVGAFLGGILPTANAWIGRLFPVHERGRAYGLSASAASLGMFFGPLLGGVVASRLGFAVVFALVGGLMLCNLIWIAVGTRDPGLAKNRA